MSSPSPPTFGGKKHWLFVADDSSNFTWVFLKEKSNLADVMLGSIKNLKNKHYLQVQYLCWDNAGRNIAFEKGCKQEGLRVDFEYTAPALQQ